MNFHKMRKVIIVTDESLLSDRIKVYSNRKKVYDKYKDHLTSYRMFCNNLEDRHGFTFKIPHAFFTCEVHVQSYYIN